MTDLTNWDDDILGEDEADDGIIELTDIVDEDSKEADNETIIELTDIVEEEGIDPDPGNKEVESTDLELDIEDESMDLNLDIEEEESMDFDPDVENEESIDLRLDIVKEDAAVGEDDLSWYKEAFTGKDPVLEPDESVKEELVEEDAVVSSIQSLSVSPEQVEAALERVIEKKFADKIEDILFEVMEKVIEKEIAEIRESLQKDLDHI